MSPLPPSTRRTDGKNTRIEEEYNHRRQQGATTMEPRLSITVGDSLIPIEPRQEIPAGKIVIGERVITHPLVVGKPAFIKHPGYLEEHEAIGIAYASVLYIDTPPDYQESIIYGDQKPMVLVSSDEFVQFIVQPLTYLKGKLKTPIMWELSTAEVTSKASLKVGS